MTSRLPSSADARARWRAAAARISEASPALASRFAEHTAALVGRTDPARIEAWAEAGLLLRAKAGWRGERLAQELFACAPRTLPVLAAEDVGRWVRLGLHCEAELDPVEFLRGLPAEIVTWHDERRRTWLETALAVPPLLAVAVYRDLPGALERVAESARDELVGAWRTAATAGNAVALAEITPLLGALLAAVPAAARSDAVAVVAGVADVFPAGFPAVLRALPRLYEAAPPERIREWAAHGLEVAARHPQAGLAFLGLVSRTSARVLEASPTAVTLDEMQGELRRVVHMLSGAPATPRPVAPFRLRPALEEEPGSAMVALPTAIDRLDDVEDNTRLYTLAAVLLAGRREFGTYEALPGGPAALRAAGRPAALEDLFLLADGVRVAARLSAAYPGVAAQLRWAGGTLAGEHTPPTDVFDALYAVALRGDSPGG